MKKEYKVEYIDGVESNYIFEMQKRLNDFQPIDFKIVKGKFGAVLVMWKYNNAK